MSGKKFYFGTEDGGMIFRTERQIGHVRIPNYVYDLWLPILGVTAIGVYSVYCRLERNDVCKGMTQRRLAKMCHIGTSKLSAINKLLQKHRFVRIRKPEKLDILRHLTMEITVMDAPKELSGEVMDTVDNYEPLSPWLMEPSKTPDGASGSTKSDPDEASDSASVFEALCLNPSDVEGNPPAQTSLPGESPQPEPQPNTNPSPQPITDPATPGDQSGDDTLTEAQPSSVPAPLLYYAGGTSSVEPPACKPALDDLPVLSVVVGYPDPHGYMPNHVSPPGETLLEKIEELEISQSELARQMGWCEKTVSEIVRGKAPITLEIALQLERVLSIPADFWNNRERQYRQYLAQREKQEYSQSTSTPPAVPPRDYLTDLYNHANRDKPGDEDTHIRPKHWETVSDDEYAICKRVADLWCGGRLPFPGSIEAHCGAAGWLLHDLNGSNLSACIRALDEYHLHYEDEQMTFTVAGPKSLVGVLPAFLAQGGGDGEPGVIRLGG